MNAPRLLLVAALLAACVSPRRDPQFEERTAQLKDRIERDREEISRQTGLLANTEIVRKTQRLTELQTALSALFAVESRVLDASAGGEPLDLKKAAASLSAVENILANGAPAK